MKQSLYKMILTVISGVFLLGSLSVQAADIKPAVIYDMGGKFDKSFNEGVWNGVKKFTEETGIKVMEFEVTNETQREQAMRQMVDRGATIVLGVGFAQADAIAAVAAENPDVQFS
ncbi:MAG: BMP family ABC transporter substrate-binding protein, partial [Candidatus Puniceispirillales bacterium]